MVAVRADLPIYTQDDPARPWRRIETFTVGYWGFLCSLRMPGDEPNDFAQYRFAEEGGK